ncbi:hypothetical protein KVT40_004875 [Elsinoe batatas]|uniref:SnoaL-like domain-containing protein n=1 Tax=Elsinoe batatas TaxID=2601811 RepID=A0A8K0PGB9_9PEZI|nr:hypothetical protein KVT40_004875 [Elsinoe batatas]
MRSVTRLITFVLVSLLAKGDCTPYPNKTQIATIFSDLGTNAGYAKFITTVVEPNVTWTLMGTHPLAGLPYDNRFAWVTRWNKQGKIEEVITYFDSALVARGITENEAPTYNYTSDRSAVVRGPVGANCGI